MRFPWRRAEPDPEPAVSVEELCELEQLRDDLAKRHRKIDRTTPEIRGRSAYLRDQRQANHIAERFRQAFQGN